MDPAFRKWQEPGLKLSAEEEKKINADLFTFLDNANKTDNQLRGIDKS
jgi:hypothetical protein